MPSNIVKSYANKSGKTVKEVDKMWNSAEEIVKDNYPNVKVGSDRYYSLVNGTLKRMLKLDEEIQNLKNFNRKYEETIMKFNNRG